MRALRSIERVLVLIDGFTEARRDSALEALRAAQESINDDPRQWALTSGVGFDTLNAVREVVRQWPKESEDRQRAQAALTDAISGMRLQQWRRQHFPPPPVIELPATVELPPIQLDAAAQADFDRARWIDT